MHPLRGVSAAPVEPEVVESNIPLSLLETPIYLAPEPRNQALDVGCRCRRLDFRCGTFLEAHYHLCIGTARR